MSSMWSTAEHERVLDGCWRGGLAGATHMRTDRARRELPGGVCAPALMYCREVPPCQQPKP